MSLQLLSRTVCAALLLSQSSHAYTTSTTPNLQPVRLRYGQKLFLAGNPGGPSAFPPAFFNSAIVHSLSQWKWATQGMFDFDYWQGTDKRVYEANLSQNGLSSVFFSSNSAEPADPNVIGYTQVWFNAKSGDIIEADILLNDRYYELTTSVQDTSSNSSSGWATRPKVYIGNILTHEIGHAIGLSHSGHINASMLFVEYSEQHKIGCDDWAGARHLYPSTHTGFGSLQGTVLSPYGDGAAGVSVTAISRARGIPIATTLTDQSGRFEFGALEAGAVALMIERFPGATSTVPARVHARTSQNICSGSNQFPTQFADVGDGHQLREFTVNAGSLTQIGSLAIRCESVQNSQSSVMTVSNSHFVVDQSQIGVPRSYRFFASGPFQVSGIGHLLLSPVKVSLQVVDSTGKQVVTQAQTPAYRSSSNYRIEDSILKGNAFGWIEIQVTPSGIPMNEYPTPALRPNANPFYLIAFNPDASRPSPSQMPDNARCTPPDVLPAYSSPAGEPIRNFGNQTSRDAMGCSQAHAGELRPSPHRDVDSVIGRLLPFLLPLLVQLYFRRRASKLKA